MNEKDLELIIAGLKQKRPIFHSEADFQYSLAREIRKMFPDTDVLLEWKFGNRHLDIFVKINDDSYAIELKYLTKKTKPEVIDINNEQFYLKTQVPAVDAYNCLKDIQRIEELSDTHGFKAGFVIWLTNDNYHWMKPSGRQDTQFEDFRIYDGITKTGEMKWKEGAKLQKSYEKPLNLTCSYEINWKHYSDIKQSAENDEFKYAILTIDPVKIPYTNTMKSTIQDRMNDPWWKETTDEETKKSFKSMVKKAEEIDKEIEKIKKKKKTNEQE